MMERDHATDVIVLRSHRRQPGAPTTLSALARPGVRIRLEVRPTRRGNQFLGQVLSHPEYLKR